MVSLRFKMARRPGSSIPQFRIRVPTDVLSELRGRRVLIYSTDPDERDPQTGRIVNQGRPFVAIPRIGMEIQFSLGIDDTTIAAARNADALHHLQKLFSLYRTNPVNLTNKDMLMYAGVVYRTYVDVHEGDPGKPSDWAYHKAIHRAVLEGRIPIAPAAALIHEDAAAAIELFGDGDLTQAVDALPANQHDGLEQRFGPLADWVLVKHQIRLAPQLRRAFLHKVGEAALDAGWRLKRNSADDYSPDPKEKRFPPLEPAKQHQSISGLFDLWWKEAEARGLARNTYDAYKGAINRLIGFLGHDDAHRVTEMEMLAFKDHRLGSVTPKTFQDGDLPGLKSVFGWAMSNRKIPVNPVAGLSVKRGKKIIVRSNWFTDEEATAIFRACISYRRKEKESASTAAAKRWAPVITAYTGCRISEALQLRRADVYEASGHYVFRFTPDAGTIKNGVYRLVPVHPHLIELGFLEFVDASSEGPLFAKGSESRLRSFIREVVPDPHVQPNHGWRHRMAFLGRRLALDPRAVEAITGHAPRTEGERYGNAEFPIEALARIIAAIPPVSV